MPLIDILPDTPPQAAATLRAVLGNLLDRIAAHDAQLGLAPLDLSGLARIAVAHRFEPALSDLERAAGLPAVPIAEGSRGVAARVADPAGGATLLLDGRWVAASLSGDADAVARLVHRLHRELCEADREARAASPREATAAGPGEATAASTGEALRTAPARFEACFGGIADAMRADYAISHRAAWSLPTADDLMLPHLAELLAALPAAMARDIATHAASGGLDGLFGTALGRLTHLLRVSANVLGSLAGSQRTLAQLSPESAALVSGSLLGPHWEPMAAELAADATHALQARVLSVLAALGLQARRTDDGGVWIDLAASGRAVAEGHA